MGASNPSHKRKLQDDHQADEFKSSTGVSSPTSEYLRSRSPLKRVCVGAPAKKILQKAKAKAKANAENSTPPIEKRLRRSALSCLFRDLNTNLTREDRFRTAPPKSFDEVFGRATTQRCVVILPEDCLKSQLADASPARFYVLSRTRCGTDDCPEEVVELTGSTGNIYKVRIAQQPSCDCPHATKGHQCKHWLYVMSRVLRAKSDHVYQLALLSSELRE